MGIFISRLLPVVRHLIGIPAGIVRMGYLKFSLFTLLGSGIWCSVLVLRWHQGGAGRTIDEWRVSSRHPLARGRDAGAGRTVLFLRPPAHGEKSRVKSKVQSRNKIGRGFARSVRRSRVQIAAVWSASLLALRVGLRPCRPRLLLDELEAERILVILAVVGLDARDDGEDQTGKANQ